ncbi:sensory transduction protein LytR [Kordia sp. SMS9]|uniref:LytR/AlgR family response regulator transcription factor n=1 Tax=Kordia sp. SMS9 TaxID=2282170 RepID=UPI000E0DB5DE|nr:response regulator transcription factor [Kordia sp. SMS9]AXG71498.1 sensory transduction protein LytR [Kordia sp. SMS9]
MEKLSIFILEDHLDEIEILKVILSEEYIISGIATNYKEAVEKFDKKTPDIAILDIFLNGEREGIRFAEYIQATHPIPILFLTNSKDRISFTEAKKHSPYNYLLKPVDPHSLKFAIELAFEKYADEVGQLSTKDENALQIDNILLIKKGNELVKVAVDDIFYIESDDKYCYIHTEDARFLVQKSLKGFAATLPENFVQLHRKYIVNTSQIKSVTPADYTLTLKNGATLPVSQRQRKLLLEIFTIIK